MKKIIVFIIALFLTLSKVSASAKFRIGEKVLPNFYVERIKGNDKHNGLLYKLLREDGEFVYCVDPFETRVRDVLYTEYNYNNSKFNITDENLDMINKIAYFGYGYQNHTDIKWYGITQFLIWQKLNLDDVFLTDSLYGNRIELYNNEINEIYNLIDEYNKLPSFAGSTITYTSNNTYELIDLNNVLDSYYVYETDLDVNIINNTLMIDTKEDGIYTIKFIKRSPIEREFKLYWASGTQSFIYPGKFNDITFNLTIKVVTGTITLNKISMDSSTDSRLDGAVYGVYKDDLLIESIITDESGVGYIDGLPIGKYTVKEIIPSLGYYLDCSIQEIEITEKNRNIFIESYEPLIYNRLILNKYYGEFDNYEKEDGAVFNIYDSKSNLYTTVETNNGIVDIKLPYGNYRIVQIYGIEGYKFVEPFNITINYNDVSYDLYDELIKGDIVLSKYNINIDDCNKEDGAIFEIYKDDILYKTVETNNGLIDIVLPYGKYLIKQIHGIEGYKFVDDFEVFISEEKEYKYDLYDELIYGNLILNKYYGDNIKEDGAIFSINDIEYKTVNGLIDITLPYGNYSIKQIKGIEGYKFVDDFEVFINEEKEYKYDLYDELIYGNLILNKYYGEPDNYNREDGAIFKVSNETIEYEGETLDGMLSMSLPYGNYRVTQLKGIEGYDYVEDFDVDITESLSDYDLYDELIVEVPNTGIESTMNYTFIIYIFLGLLCITFSLKRLKE